MNDIDENFSAFLDEQGVATLKRHVVELNTAAMLEGRDVVFRLIDELAEDYPDPVLGAAALIEIWEYLVSPKTPQ